VIASSIARRLVGPLEVRQMAEGHTLVIATVRAKVGKNTTELWQLQARDRPAQAVLMRLGSGDASAVQGVPNTRVATVGKPVIQHVLFAEHVTTLKPEGGGDGSL
jgi:hypothetical protein